MERYHLQTLVFPKVLHSPIKKFSVVVVNKRTREVVGSNMPFNIFSGDSFRHLSVPLSLNGQVVIRHRFAYDDLEWYVTYKGQPCSVEEAHRLVPASPYLETTFVPREDISEKTLASLETDTKTANSFWGAKKISFSKM